MLHLTLVPNVTDFPFLVWQEWTKYDTCLVFELDLKIELATALLLTIKIQTCPVFGSLLYAESFYHIFQSTF